MLPLQSSYTTGQTAISLAVLVGILVAAAVARARLHYRGLDASAREHVQAVVGAKVTTEPASERLEKAVATSDAMVVREHVQALVDRAKAADSGGSVRPTRVVLGEAWADLTDSLPARSRQLGELAVLIIVFSPIAVSADVLQAWLAADPNTSPDALLSLVGSSTGALLGTAQDTLALFPYAGIVWAFAFLLTILGIEWLYAHWWLVALAVATSAVGIWQLDDDLDVGGQPYAPLRERAVGTLGAVGLVWLLGTLPAVAGSTLALDAIGSVVGFLLAFVAGAVIAYRRTRRYLRRLTTVPTDEDEVLPAIGYRLARSASGLLLVVAALLAPLWVAVALVSGNLFAIAGSLLGADPVVQMIVLLGLGGLAAGIGSLIQETWPEVRERLLETAVRSRIRAAIWAQGVPLFAGALLYAGLTEMTSLPVAALLALIVVLGIRWVAGLLATARYAVSLRDRATPDRGQSPFIEVWVAADASGNPQYIGRVSGTELAHTDQDAFVDAVTDAAMQVADDGDVAPSVPAVYHERLTEAGIVDVDEARAALREEVEKVAFDALRDDDGDKRVVRREWFDAQLDEYPEPVVDDALSFHAEQGNIHLTSDTVALRSDPRAVSRTASRGPQQVTA
jgi:hypothetical protein